MSTRMLKAVDAENASRKLPKFHDKRWYHLNTWTWVICLVLAIVMATINLWPDKRWRTDFVSVSKSGEVEVDHGNAEIQYGWPKVYRNATVFYDSNNRERGAMTYHFDWYYFYVDVLVALSFVGIAGFIVEKLART